MWCFLFGENLVEGISGFGETPYRAAVDFCNNFMWEKAVPESDLLFSKPAG